MSLIHYISTEILDLSTIKEIVEENKKLSLSEEAILNIKKSHTYLSSKIENNESPISVSYTHLTLPTIYSV